MIIVDSSIVDSFWTILFCSICFILFHCWNWAGAQSPSLEQLMDIREIQHLDMALAMHLVSFHVFPVDPWHGEVPPNCSCGKGNSHIPICISVVLPAGWGSCCFPSAVHWWDTWTAGWGHMWISWWEAKGGSHYDYGTGPSHTWGKTEWVATV